MANGPSQSFTERKRMTCHKSVSAIHRIIAHVSLLIVATWTAAASPQSSLDRAKEGSAAGLSTDPKDSTPNARLAPALDPNSRRQALVGRWYGESMTADGQSLKWVTNREANGTYRTQYLLNKDEPEESIEIGQWGLSGSVFFTIQRVWIRNGETQRVDGSNAYSYDAYDITNIAEQSLEYRSAGSGKRFTVRRVGTSFELGRSVSK
jgi:hypothetical protein